MTFTLTIDMNNAAFDDPEQELAVCLTRVAVKITTGITDTGIVRDSNGNTVGSWEIK
jgi:hypothetical protein